MWHETRPSIPNDEKQLCSRWKTLLLRRKFRNDDEFSSAKITFLLPDMRDKIFLLDAVFDSGNFSRRFFVVYVNHK